MALGRVRQAGFRDVWRGVRWGGGAGLIGAAALIALVLATGPGEGDIGACYLAYSLGWPMSHLLLRSEKLGWIVYWKEFVTLSLVLGWAAWGAVAGYAWGWLRLAWTPRG